MSRKLNPITGTPLSPKQMNFVKSYIENGQNGTDAAKQSYNIKNDSVASSIATENLRKPDVQTQIKKMLKNKGLTVDYVGEKFKTIIDNATDDKRLANATVQDAIKSLQFIAKFNGMLDKNTTITKTTVKYDFSGKSRDEIRAEVGKMGDKFKEYVITVE
jgi:phage terminase small subunit